jgi:hypothetical protein
MVMRLVALCHEIPPRGERLSWVRDKDGYYKARVETSWGPLTIRVNNVTIQMSDGLVWAGDERIGWWYVGAVSRSGRDVQRAWALGYPALLADDWYSVYGLTIRLAEALAPTIQPAPLLSGSVLGFRGYTSPSIGQKTPWWEWDNTRAPQCCPELGSCAHPPGWDCACGFHVSVSAWAAAEYARTAAEQHVLVVAPFGRVIEHEVGERCEHYDVLAAVYPLDVPAPDDPRVIRARNVPLRAWEVAQELLVASRVEEVLA